MNWTVSRRIMAGFGLLLALVAAVAVIGIWALSASVSAYDTALTHERDRLITAFDARGALRNANVAYLRFITEPEESHAAAFDLAIGTAREKLNSLGRTETDRELRQMWPEALRRLEQWEAAARDAMQLARAGNIQAALQQRRERVQPLRQQAEQRLEEGVAVVQQQTDAQVDDAQQRAESSRLAIWLALAAALVAGIIAAFLLNRAIAGPLQETSTVLATSAAEIAASTTEQASGATESLAAVSQTAATVDQVVQTADQAAERARAVAQSSQHAATIGREGRLAVEESIATMDQVREQVESIANRILALAEQAQAIGEIISTVNDLADQTNLLALNAAIEAARAGEQGRGFAVVASEVRALAEQSKASTVRVRDILGQIQRATSAAVMATENGSKQVAEGTRQANEAGDRIRALTEAISDAAQAAAQIAASAGQQSTGMTQIRQAIANIQQAAQQNLAATRQTEKASQELSRMGNELIALVGVQKRTSSAG